MMKQTLFLLAFALIVPAQAKSQVKLQGIALKNINSHQKGDTLQVVGCKTKESNPEKRKFLVKTDDGTSYVNQKRIKVLDTNLDYWERVWFYYRSGEIYKYGWNYNTRNILDQEAKSFYRKALENKQVYKEEMVYNYLYSLLHRVHPGKLHKHEESYLTLMILESDNKEYYSFNNGLIVLTTSLLADVKNQKELISILSECVASIVLEHDLVKIEKEQKNEQTSATIAGCCMLGCAALFIADVVDDGYSDLYLGDAVNLGVATYAVSSAVAHGNMKEYSETQKKQTREVVKKYMDHHMNLETLTEKAFVKKLNLVIRFEAWQSYHARNFVASEKLIRRMLDNGMATTYDYILLAKLYRETNVEEDKIRLLIALLEKEKETTSKNIIELDKELGHLHAMLNETNKAIEYFESYKSGILELDDPEFDKSDELKIVNIILEELEEIKE